MRRLILPTCLFMSAWAPAAGPLFEIVPAENLANVTFVEKSVGATSAPVLSEPQRVQVSVETTEQLTTLGGNTEDANLALPAEPELAETPPIPLPPRRVIPHRIVCEELALAASNNNLPAPFLIKLINQESGFNQNAVSRAGAQGVAQFMPATAASMQLVDPFDPLKALHASAQLLRGLFEQFGNNLGLAAAAYNAGPKRVQEWLAKRGKLPQETRDYVQRITGRAAEQWRAQPVAAQLRVPSSAPCQREAGLFASNGPAIIPLPPTHPGSGPAGKTPPHAVMLAWRADGRPTAPRKKAPAIVVAGRMAKPGKVKKMQVADARPAHK
jgi:hypothetical protein